MMCVVVLSYDRRRSAWLSNAPADIEYDNNINRDIAIALNIQNNPDNTYIHIYSHIFTYSAKCLRYANRRLAVLLISVAALACNSIRARLAAAAARAYLIGTFKFKLSKREISCNGGY